MFLSSLNRPRKTTLSEIPDGPSGTLVTLKVMAVLAREASRRQGLREFAARLALGACPTEKDWLCQIKAVHEYVRDQIRYLRDIVDVETVQEPEVTMQMAAGDCDDKVTLACALLNSIGHPCRMVALRFNPNPDFSHVVAETKLADRWVGMELTEPWPLGKIPPASERMVVKV